MAQDALTHPAAADALNSSTGTRVHPATANREIENGADQRLYVADGALTMADQPIEQIANVSAANVLRLTRAPKWNHVLVEHPLIFFPRSLCWLRMPLDVLVSECREGSGSAIGIACDSRIVALRNVSQRLKRERVGIAQRHLRVSADLQAFLNATESVQQIEAFNHSAWLAADAHAESPR